MHLWKIIVLWLRKLRHRPALLTILANNGSTLSFTITNLVSVPFALHFLTTKEFGLWTFTSQSIGYFLLLDLGVSVAVSRLLAEPIAHADSASANQWLTFSALVMATQGVLIGLSGWFLVDSLLVWFDIPSELMPQARSLWFWMLVLTVVQYLIRIVGGILYAQNRYYWNNFGSAVAAWVGLAGFVFFLKRGHGVMAYAYSSALQTACACWIPCLGVRLGPDRFRLDFRKFNMTRLRQLYGFSGALSLTQIAGLVIVSGQTLIVTKILGLEAAAGYNVSSKIILTARNVLLQLFQSFLPGWQRLFLRGELKELIRQWRLRFDLVMSVALVCATFFIAINRWFVMVWARPDLYQGFGFDLASAMFCVVGAVACGFTFPQVFAMLVWRRSILHLTAAATSVLLGILLTPIFGTSGVLWGGTIVFVFGTIWYEIYQFKVLVLRPEEELMGWRHWKCLRSLVAFSLSAILIGMTGRCSNRVQISLAAIVVMGSIGLFLSDWKSSLAGLVSGREFRQSQSLSVERQEKIQERS